VIDNLIVGHEAPAAFKCARSINAGLHLGEGQVAALREVAGDGGSASACGIRDRPHRADVYVNFAPKLARDRHARRQRLR
jgi:hypothetical protein